MAKAGVTLAAGASMAPQSTEAVNAAAAKKRGAKPAPVLGALSTQLHSRALTASETAYMQVSPVPYLLAGKPLCSNALVCCTWLGQQHLQESALAAQSQSAASRADGAGQR